MNTFSLVKVLESSVDEGFRKAKLDYSALVKAQSLQDVFLIVKNAGLTPEKSGRYYLGSGSSRSAFILSPKRALKIANNNAGIAQNQAELDVARDYQDYVPNIYGADENGKWLIVDIVRQLKSEEEFQEVSGFFLHDILDIMRMSETLGLNVMNMGMEDAQVLEEYIPDMPAQQILNVVKNDWVLGLYEMIANKDLAHGDIALFGHWGLTASGRLVMLDTGLTSDVWHQHYDTKDGKPESFKFEEVLGGKVKFNLSHLKSLETHKAIWNYVKQLGLRDSTEDQRFLGEGSSRTVFYLSPKKVIKIPIENGYDVKNGMAQNRNEAAISLRNPKYTAKTFAMGKEGLWLITELVRPFESPMDFQESTGFPFEKLEDVIKYGIEPENDWILGVKTMIHKEDLYESDLNSPYNWGKTGDGRVVLFDPGATNSYMNALDEALSRTRFSLRDLKQKQNLIQVKQYVDSTLQQDRKLGAGSSRTAYSISPRFVLKVARDLKAGLAQNLAEIEVFKKNPAYVTKIYDYDPNGRWIIAEPVREFNDSDDMVNLKGFSLAELNVIAKDPYLKREFDYLSGRGEEPEYFQGLLRKAGEPIELERIEKMFEPENKKWIDGLFKFYFDSDLAVGDFWFFGHWGKTANDRVVLLDSGATNEVMSAYYGQRNKK